MPRITHIHEMVKDILTRFPETRNKDSYLHCRLLETYYGSGYVYQPYIITLQDESLPSIESVGRARRKCQELYPELRADDNTQAARELKEEEYEDYVMRARRK